MIKTRTVLGHRIHTRAGLVKQNQADLVSRARHAHHCPRYSDLLLLTTRKIDIGRFRHSISHRSKADFHPEDRLSAFWEVRIVILDWMLWTSQSVNISRNRLEGGRRTVR